MTFTNPFINALLAAVLGILVVVIWSWSDPFEHKHWMLFIAIGCGALGFYFGESFVRLLMGGI